LNIIFRDSVKNAFQPVQRKCQFDAQIMRVNSNDCSNEVEDVMSPWLFEDLADDTPIVTIQ
jgi:hypothetical protein